MAVCRPVPEVHCGRPPKVQHSECYDATGAACAKNLTVYSPPVTYRCNPGYTATGVADDPAVFQLRCTTTGFMGNGSECKEVPGPDPESEFCVFPLCFVPKVDRGEELNMVFTSFRDAAQQCVNDATCTGFLYTNDRVDIEEEPATQNLTFYLKGPGLKVESARLSLFWSFAVLNGRYQGGPPSHCFPVVQPSGLSCFPPPINYSER